MSEISELLERVKAFDGNDDTLEGEIFNAVIGVDAPDAREWYGNGRSILTSVDRSFALVDRLFPNLVIVMTRIGDGTGHLQVTEAWVSDRDFEVLDSYNPFDPMPPALAITAALLQALQEQVKP